MEHFSDSYDAARTKFLNEAGRLNATVDSYYLDSARELAIDVATIGDATAPTLVLSSGLHGVEGFFGSAVQIALLEQLNGAGLDNMRYVLIHALNPYGFKHLRRFDEENIDLNRNFLLPEDDYQGVADGYTLLDKFLNPQSRSSGFEMYRLKSVYYILRYGIPSLKASIVCGQYEHPQGIFFGGKNQAITNRLIEQHYDQWIGNSESVLHIDLHTGLGSFGAYKLLLNEAADTGNYQWYVDTFGEQNVEPLTEPDGTAYPVKGSLGIWLQNRMQSRQFRYVGAEFGTYGPVRVLGAIRAENRAFHYGYKSQRHRRSFERELVECFCPGSKNWRQSVLDSAMNICNAAIVGLKRQGN